MHCRKNFLDLTDDEKTRLAAAFNAIYADGVIEEHAHHHSEYFFKGIHFGPAFLPWHRSMLLMVEQALQSHDPTVMLPYWDWTRADSQDLDVEPWLSFFGGRSGKGLFPTWDFTRGSSPSGSLPTQASVLSALNELTFADFRALECGIHSAPHVWVGGTMAGAESPMDPLFYLHHGNIDRLWAIWQLNHPAVTQYTLDSDGACDSVDEAFVALNDPMVDGATPASMLDHAALGYHYPTDDLIPAPLISGDPTEVTLLTPQIIFNDVPEGETTMRAALFSVECCEDLSFEVEAPGPAAPFSLYSPGPYPYPQPGSLPTDELRVWFLFTGGTPGSAAVGTVTIVAKNMFGDEIKRFENIPMFANSVKRPKVAVALVLDESGSMLSDAGNGRTRLEVLQLAATTFVDQLFDDNGVAIVSFADTAETVMDLTIAGDLASAARADARNEIAAHGPPDEYPNTSIGAGLQQEDAMYAASPLSGDFDIRSTIVFTDGFENREPLISQVQGLIDERVYAIGVADAANVANDVLSALADNTGGYMLVTGAIPDEDQFLLEKFFIQVLAGVTNRDIVLDPDGWLVPGQIASVPFSIARSDIGFDAIALTRAPHYVLLGLVAPDGSFINQSQVGPGQFRLGNTSGSYRITLPLVVGGKEHWEGEWQLVLGLAGMGDVKLTQGWQPGISRGTSLPYHAIVHARSNLHLRARLTASGTAPGSQLNLRALLTEYGQPLRTHPAVTVTYKRPDGTIGAVTMLETAAGEFDGAIIGTQAGVYRFLVRANGLTGRGHRFTREQMVTAVLGRSTGQPTTPTGGHDEDPWRDFLCCALKSGALSDRFIRRLESWGIDFERLRGCLRGLCGRGNDKTPRIN